MLEIKNPYALKKGCVGITDIGEPRVMQEIAFNQGATAYHKAVVKWGDEDCPHASWHETKGQGVKRCKKHNCDLCWKEFKEGK